jgi:hypothetical protein
LDTYLHSYFITSSGGPTFQGVLLSTGPVVMNRSASGDRATPLRVKVTGPAEPLPRNSVCWNLR